MFSKEIIKAKLGAFKRKFFKNSYLFKKLIEYNQYILSGSKRKLKRANYVIINMEEFTAKELTADIFLAYGRFGFVIFLISTFLSALVIVWFPFEVSDTVIFLSKFLWHAPILPLLLFPLLCSLFLIFIPKRFIHLIPLLNICFSFTLFFYSLVLLGRFDLSSPEFQFQFRFSNFESINFTEFETEIDPKFMFTFIVGVDLLSLLLIVLTAFIFCICTIVNTLSIRNFVKENSLAYFLLVFFIIFALSSLDIVLFYVFFEATLVPLFFIIGIWGSRVQKLSAAYKLFFFTLTGSMLTLVGLLLLMLVTGTSDIFYLSFTSLEPSLQKILWILFFSSFAVKLPMIPFHLWLPEAHVEAPTSGSIILAGILLKLGGYGFFRFLVTLLPDATLFFMPFVHLLSSLAVVYCALLALRQNDIKKIIAYSSITHMGFVTLAIVCLNETASTGALFIMLGHGFTSSALFACVGVLYDRYKTKLLIYYNSLASSMPLFSTFFFVFTLSNIGLPGTIGFVGEFLALSGSVTTCFVPVCICIFNAVFSAAYSLWLFNRIVFGKVSTLYIKFYQDLNELEFLLLFALAVPVVLFGLFPDLLLSLFEYFIGFNNMVITLKLFE